MAFNIARLNLSERDIEDWLYENPQSVSLKNELFVVDRWIGRQYKLPSGIADLVGWTSSEHIIVAEIKNVPADGKAIAQVCRYAHDIANIAQRHWGYHWVNDVGPYIPKVVIAPSFDSMTTYFEAEACGVFLLEFSVSLTVNTNESYPKSEADGDRLGNYWDDIAAIAKGKEWDMLGPFTSIEEEYMDQVKAHARAFRREMTHDGGDTEHF